MTSTFDLLGPGFLGTSIRRSVVRGFHLCTQINISTFRAKDRLLDGSCRADRLRIRPSVSPLRRFPRALNVSSNVQQLVKLGGGLAKQTAKYTFQSSFKA